MADKINGTKLKKNQEKDIGFRPDNDYGGTVCSDPVICIFWQFVNILNCFDGVVAET